MNVTKRRRQFHLQKSKKSLQKILVRCFKTCKRSETAIEKPKTFRRFIESTMAACTKELKETSNQNHEIDELLARKIHDSFVATFPFMIHADRISPTVHYYKIG